MNRFLCKNQKRFLIFRIHYVVFVGFNLFCVSIENFSKIIIFILPETIFAISLLRFFLFLFLSLSLSAVFLFYPVSRPYIICYAPFIRTYSGNMLNFACQRLDMCVCVRARESVFPLQIKHTILIELVIIIMHHFQVNFRIQHSTGADRLKSTYIIFLGSTHFTKTLTSSPILQQRSSGVCALKHTTLSHSHTQSHTHFSDTAFRNTRKMN